MILYFASGNSHKKKELERFFVPDTIRLPAEAGVGFEHEETENTFYGNALSKAYALFRKTGQPALADDSGLCVDALDGAPGIYTARYGDAPGKILNSAQKYGLLLNNMAAKENRSARFVCALALVLGENRHYLVEETWEGEIALSASGTHGFGYDPVFIPSGFDCTAAQLPEDIKEKISHRGKAAAMMGVLWKKITKELN
jgi:XTP/dITP diphosphohydrolase